MPLAQPLPDLRRQLQEILAEDLAAALNALKELLPEGSEKHRAVLELRARLNEANKQNFRGVITPEQLQLVYNQIRSAVFDLLESLEEGDFEMSVKKGGAASAKATAVKHGSVLYRVPHRMPLRKPTICTVRVALDEEAILEDIVLDAEVRLRPRVEVSDMMKAELLDPEGDVFAIRPLSEAEQLVRETGYTQWLFSVTPRVEGEHQLLVKVSMMEFNEKIGKYVPREVSILETVTIVTETAISDSDEAPLKATGERFTLGPDASRGIGEEPPAAVVPPAPALNIPRPSTIYTPPQPSTVGRPTSVPRGLRAVAFFLAFLLVGSTATWAFTPPPTRDWWVASLKDSAEAYAGYIEKYKDTEAKQHLEKAYFRKADKTEALADLREYQREFPQGQFREQVTEKVTTLEIKSLNDIRQQPDAGKILRFAQDFPESERLPTLRDVVTDRADLLPALENAYVASIQAQASPRKVEAFLRDFPKSERLPEVAKVLEARPEVLRQVQPELDSLIVRSVESANSAAEVKAILPVLESAGSSASAQKVERAVAQKPQLKKQVLPQVQQAIKRVQQREAINRQRTAEEADEKARLDELRRRARDEKNAAERARLEKEAAEEAERQRLKKETEETERQRIEAEARRDTDGDGVPDKDDKCPDKKGKAEWQGCPSPPCSGDNDFDGICDNTDNCPGVANPTQADADLDGVGDACDKCPNEKGDAANNGCPPPKSRKSGLEMVPVQGGTFTMGCQDGRDKDCLDNEKPSHTVTLTGFLIGKYEVTQADWREVMGADPPELYNKGCDDCPVENVSLKEVQEFIRTLNKVTTGRKTYRLPTEAEWEYAARGGPKSEGYIYSGSNETGKVAWHADNYKTDNTFGARKTTRPVGTKAPNELGLHDMSGNVYEWCSDWYGDYPAGAQVNPTGPKSGSNRVLRGGSWVSIPRYARAAYRSNGAPAGRGNDAGFRLARTN